MKKKLMSLSLALVMCLSLAIPASAADVPSENEIPDGTYTFTRKGTGDFVQQRIRTGYGTTKLEDETYANVYTGYYTLSPDAAWTVKNTSADKSSLISISVSYYAPAGNNDYIAGVGYGVLIGRNGFGGNTASGEDWENLERLRPGDSATFTLADVLAHEKMGIKDVNIGVGREDGETDGLVLVVDISVDDMVDYNDQRDVYCYMISGDVPGTTKPGTTNPTTPNFTDVKAGDWFYEAVMWAVKKEITTGTTATTFSPDETCTEAQILTFLWRAMGKPAPAKPIPSEQYFAQAAGWAVQTGILDEFEADTPCTRAMTVDYLWHVAGKPESSTKLAFTDVPSGTDLEKAVAWAVETGVTTGTSATTFSPNTTCTRGEIVTFLYRDMGK